jgi:hypothetical protein
MRSLFALMLCLAASGTLAADDGIRFDAVITHKGAVVSAPSLAIGFGQEAVIEVPATVRIVALAAPPVGGISHVSAKFFVFKAGRWVLDWESAMEADITRTPSFEWDLSTHPYHVVLKPRRATLQAESAAR